MFTAQQNSELATLVTRTFTNPGTRLDAFTLATAYAISRDLPLPSSEVDNPELYFTNSASLGLQQLIDHINDAVLIDRHAARAAVKAFWMVRYNNVFPADWQPDSEYDFFCSNSCVPQYFTKGQFVILNDNKQGVRTIALHLKRLFAECK